MPRFSANLGFLWADLPLPDRVRAAAAADFEAVECHWPYAVDPHELRAALDQTGLAMLSLNTPCGDRARGEFGLAALPGRRREATSGIDLAIDYALATGTRNIHVMAGICDDQTTGRAAFVETLGHAAMRAAPHDIGILIEPINRFDRPGYFLHRTDQARAIIDELAMPSIRLMFDCYHVQKTEGNLTMRLMDHLDIIGHVQIAAVPDRGEPDSGEVDYPWLFGQLDAIGYRGFVGAEYVPRGDTLEGLGWYARQRAAGSPVRGGYTNNDLSRTT